MQSIREKSERGELLKVPNALGKATFWKNFYLITTANNEPIGHVQYRICKHILAHDSKKQEHLIYNGMSSVAVLQLMYIYSFIFVGMIVGCGSYVWGL